MISLEQRVIKLERHKRISNAAVFVLVLLVAGLAAAQRENGVVEVIRAKRIEVVNDEGQTQILLRQSEVNPDKDSEEFKNYRRDQDVPLLLSVRKDYDALISARAKPNRHPFPSTVPPAPAATLKSLVGVNQLTLGSVDGRNEVYPWGLSVWSEKLKKEMISIWLSDRKSPYIRLSNVFGDEVVNIQANKRNEGGVYVSDVNGKLKAALQ